VAEGKLRRLALQFFLRLRQAHPPNEVGEALIGAKAVKGGIYLQTNQVNLMLLVGSV